MALKHDSQGFLTGEPYDLGTAVTAYNALLSIRADVRAIRAALTGTNQRLRPPGLAQAPKPGTAYRPASLTSTTPKATPVAASGLKPRPSTTTVAGQPAATAASLPARDAKGRFTASPAQAYATPRRGQAEPRRDAQGRYAGAGGEANPTAGNAVINAAATRIASALGLMGSMDEADPTVRAVQEVAEPMKRSYETIFGTHESRQKESWWRKLFGELKLFRKESSAFDKEATKRLKAIEQKPTGSGAASEGFFSKLGRAATTALGIGAGSAAGAAGGGLLSRLFGRGKGAGAEGAAKPGLLGKLFGKTSLLGKFARKLPWLAALFEGAETLSDQAQDELDPNLSEDEKVKRRYQRGGDFASKMAGMATGAASGAALGGMVGGPVGAAVGGFAGGVGGYMLGDEFGEKIGGWTQTLIDADIPGLIVEKWGQFIAWAGPVWDKAVTWMGTEWQSFTKDANVAWNAVTSIFSNLANSFKTMMKDKFGVDVDAIGANLKRSAALVGDAIQENAGIANDWLKDKTGVDIKGNLKAGVEAAQTIGENIKESIKFGAEEALKNAKGMAAGALDSAGNAIKGAWGTIEERAARNRKGAVAGGGTFDTTAPGVMRQLMDDFGLSQEQAAGIVGNLAHESGGLQAGIQEKNPIAGRGGLGWAQWTGPRRRAFEKYLADTGQQATDPAANYGFLKQELSTTHRSALDAVKRASTPEDAMMAFEQKYEAAGVKHYASRQRFTDRAMALSTRPLSLPKPPAIAPPPPVAEAPQIQMPLNSPAQRQPVQVTLPPPEAGQDLSDRTLAHIATGGIGGLRAG